MANRRGDYPQRIIDEIDSFLSDFSNAEKYQEEYIFLSRMKQELQENGTFSNYQDMLKCAQVLNTVHPRKAQPSNGNGEPTPDDEGR